MNIQLQTITLRERVDQALERLQTENAEMQKALAMWLWLMNEPDGFRWETPQHRIAFAEAQRKIAIAKMNKIAALSDEFDDVWVKVYDSELMELLNQHLGINQL